jgi:hypothetical protein
MLVLPIPPPENRPANYNIFNSLLLNALQVTRPSRSGAQGATEMAETERRTAHVQLTEFDRRLAQARAGQLGKTLSEYIAELVRADATESGMLALFSGKEVSNG